MAGPETAITIIGMVMGVGAIAIITEHFQKIAQIKAKARSGADDATREALDALRRDVSALRDTTTQYDVSFDTALQRLEQNVAQMDRRLSTVEQQQAQAGRN